MKELTELHRRDLQQQALAARQSAYAPYSRFLVGAAILTKSGAVFRGANIENASFGLTICAERVAQSAAVMAGALEFSAVAIATAGGVAPCGACRQFLREFVKDAWVDLIDAEGQRPPRLLKLSDLLPDAFGPLQLPHP